MVIDRQVDWENGGGARGWFYDRTTVEALAVSLPVLVVSSHYSFIRHHHGEHLDRWPMEVHCFLHVHWRTTIT